MNSIQKCLVVPVWHFCFEAHLSVWIIGQMVTGYRWNLEVMHPWLNGSLIFAIMTGHGSGIPAETVWGHDPLWARSAWWNSLFPALGGVDLPWVSAGNPKFVVVDARTPECPQCIPECGIFPEDHGDDEY